MPQQDTVLIVGGGQAGAWVAATLRAEGFAGRVILVGAETHLPYERPPLSKGILAGDEPNRAFLRSAHDYASMQIELRTGTEVTQLDLDRRNVRLRDGGLIAFDKLVLATGSAVRRLRIPGSDLANVVYLRTMDDALTLRAHLSQRPRTVIIGGGLIGLEAAASAKALHCEVTVLEAQPDIMQRVAPPEIRTYFQQAHRDRGVTIYMRTAVQKLEGHRQVERVACEDGLRLEADLVIVAIGVVPDTELAMAAGLSVDNGIVVDAYGRASHGAVYAAGDVTNHPNALLGRRVRLESWHNAQNQAIAVGKAIGGAGKPYMDLPWFWTDQFDLNLQMAGMPTSWDRVVIRGDSQSAEFSAFYIEGQCVVGVSTINRPRDMSFGRRLIEQRVAVNLKTLADDQIPLKTLLK